MEMIKAEIKEVKSKIEIMKTTERAMSDLLLSKQNHIADLRNENAELRNVGKLHQHEVDELRAERKEKAVISDKYGDIAESHKRLLAENRRFRSMMANKAMQETNAATERSELEGEIEDLERKLRKAQKRILQLENWMDDIYSGKEYAMIPRNDGLRGSVLSLPEIPLLDTSRSNKLTARMTSRREAPVERITARTLAELPR
ncbi:hypothetical protein LSH36_208g04083 [Paralvinella palmiformis]|uniref:Uncharacterized protein n=1 Tax=Paralvinella palmiformis TaxID=53620 RepID=A0AAD9N6B3_9ANNE|nr:hypothetical protein LSH36_208g04083 [Paralvinella palmiformis]